MIDAVLDISHHQTLGASAFHDMQDAGILAICHKASEIAEDAKYKERMARAAAVGILWGAYHFAHTKASPKSQAEWFIHVAGNAELFMFDWETNEGNGTMDRAQAEQFVQRFHDLKGFYPVLYSGESFLRAQLSKVKPTHTILSNCRLWIAKYSKTAPKAPWSSRTWDLWQYTSTGKVKGIAGHVDRNRFKGDAFQLKNWWGCR